MPSGPSTRLRKMVPSGAPSITSSTAPSTSVARLYSQQVPGVCTSGSGPSAAASWALLCRREPMRALR